MTLWTCSVLKLSISGVGVAFGGFESQTVEVHVEETNHPDIVDFSAAM